MSIDSFLKLFPSLFYFSMNSLTITYFFARFSLFGLFYHSEINGASFMT